MTNGCDEMLALLIETSMSSSTPGSLSRPDFLTDVTWPVTVAPRGNAVDPFATSGCVSTPVNSSPALAVSLDRFSLIRTLIGVPAGKPGDLDECLCACINEPNSNTVQTVNNTLETEFIIYA